LDEHLRGPLRRAVRNHNAIGSHAIDAVRVGDPPGLPLGSQDPDILVWAEAAGRILVSHDFGTMPPYFWQHLQTGAHSPGLLLVRKGSRIEDLVAELALIAHAGDPADYLDQIDFIP
jgi:hypothetical protein